MEVNAKWLSFAQKEPNMLTLCLGIECIVVFMTGLDELTDIDPNAAFTAAAAELAANTPGITPMGSAPMTYVQKKGL